MIKKKRIPLESFTPESSDKVLLDTNILIKLFYPVAFDLPSDKYDNLYKSLLANKSSLIITSIQISEFINRCIRIQFSLYQSQINEQAIEFKRDYRSTDDYREKMSAILDIIKTDIIPNFQFVDDNFSSMEKENIFVYGFSYDFNDALLMEVARTQNAILVTDDFDFANYGSEITIVTSNKFLLMSH